MLCPLCNSLQGVGPLPPREEYFDKLLTRSFKNTGIASSDLSRSAETCYCCCILLEGVTAYLQQQGFSFSHVSELDFTFLYDAYQDADSDADKTITCRFLDRSEFVVEIFTLDDDDCPCPDAWESIPTSMRTSAETGSQAAFEKACKWLEQCESEFHGESPGEGEDPEDYISHCATARMISASTPQLPTRVVDVGRHDGKIRLVEGKGLISPYLCLSHCWGLQQIITTTTSTLAERMTEINISDLSNTFREAVLMTRRFNIDHIWIDSLCIVQDDAADWERESAKMASIYQNAYLTLAATKSSSGAGGLFTVTPDFVVEGTTPLGEDYYLAFRQKIEHEFSTADILSQFPLMTRAWVYQERMLSPRVLHFGSQELFFECASATLCECGNIGFFGNGAEVPLADPRGMYASALDSVAALPNGELSNELWIEERRYYVARVWRSFVAFYTGLQITVASDRLPALSGVARTFAQKTKSPYLAGLFEETLLDDLLWHTYNGTKSPRLGEWRAPTWSWASIDTPIHYRDELTWYDAEVHTEEQEDRVEIATIEHCTSTPAGLDDFGRVSSAFLLLSGQLLPARLLLNPVLDRAKRPRYCVEIQGMTAIPRIWPDYDLSHAGPDQVLPGREVCCLRIIRHPEDKFDTSLILRPVSGENERSFARIGILQLDQKTPELDCLETEERNSVIKALDKALVEKVRIV